MCKCLTGEMFVQTGYAFNVYNPTISWLTEARFSCAPWFDAYHYGTWSCPLLNGGYSVFPFELFKFRIILSN